MRRAVFLIVSAGVVTADDIILKNGTAYAVPEGKVWLVSDAPVSDCDVCTADVYIGGLSVLWPAFDATAVILLMFLPPVTQSSKSLTGLD